MNAKFIILLLATTYVASLSMPKSMCGPAKKVANVVGAGLVKCAKGKMPAKGLAILEKMGGASAEKKMEEEAREERKTPDILHLSGFREPAWAENSTLERLAAERRLQQERTTSRICEPAYMLAAFPLSRSPSANFWGYTKR